MKQFITLSTIFAILINIISCKAIIEPSIAKRQIVAEAPGDQYQSLSYTINYWWDPVEDALTYHLQVVTPDFNKIGALVLDTIVKSNRFATNMQPGNYQWRVSAANGSSETQFSIPKTFSVVSSSLKQQTVQLISPANSFVSNQSSVNLQWGTLYGATSYQLEIDTNNFVNENSVIYNQGIPGQQYTFTFPKDKQYQWRVRAQNDTAKALWSAVYNVVYDHTPPDPVTLLSPGNNQSNNLPVTLQWSTAVSAIKYKVYAFKADSTTIYNSNFPVTVTINTYNFATGNSGDRVYWKVTAVDAVGNESKASALRNFIVQ